MTAPVSVSCSKQAIALVAMMLASEKCDFVRKAAQSRTLSFKSYTLHKMSVSN